MAKKILLLSFNLLAACTFVLGQKTGKTEITPWQNGKKAALLQLKTTDHLQPGI